MSRRRKLSICLAALLGVLAPASPASGAGETFEVTFCSSLNRSHGGTIETTNAFSARSLCSDASNDNAIKIESVARATEGRTARVYWEAPEHLAITGVNAEARLRRSEGYKAQLYMADAVGRLTQEVANGNREAVDFEPVEWTGQPQRRFVASLECTEGPSCDPSVQAKTWVRDLTFTVADYSDPEVEIGGSLFEPGWKRGEQVVSIVGRDLGAGLSKTWIAVNGVSAGDQSGVCAGEISSSVARQFNPCVGLSSLEAPVTSDQSPFEEGSNTVISCAADFAGNGTCRENVVRVDNTAPVGLFSGPQHEDPEFIQVLVTEEHSGVESGNIAFRQVGTTEWQGLLTHRDLTGLSARVDSTSVPPGAYEFRAQVMDVAGNASETVLREDGSPMVLQFPLKSGVDLNARIEPGGSTRTTVRYGRSAVAEGRLMDASGAPMASHSVVVDEYFGEGALIAHRTRTVMTDEEGRWSSKLPAGPSRSVAVTYAGDQRYLPDQAAAGRLAVKSGARMGLTRSRVPEGRSTTFKGRIGRLGARIPSRGKGLQLQYQEPTSGRWLTVRNPFRTRSDGWFRFRYSFGTHYETNVAIRFRLKVPSERGWPYRGTHTRGRRVIVQAR